MSKDLWTCTIEREYEGDAGTHGKLFSPDGKYFCRTLERPKEYNGLQNQRDNKGTLKINESCCIPEGEYIVEFTYSPRLKRKTFEIMNVSGRDAIRIHAANAISELLGCTALGYHINRMVKHTDGIVYPLYLRDSARAVKDFEKIAPKRFKLIIKSANKCSI